jgi:hypothetical protein
MLGGYALAGGERCSLAAACLVAGLVLVSGPMHLTFVPAFMPVIFILAPASARINLKQLRVALQGAKRGKRPCVQPPATCIHRAQRPAPCSVCSSCAAPGALVLDPAFIANMRPIVCAANASRYDAYALQSLIDNYGTHYIKQVYWGGLGERC